MSGNVLCDAVAEGPILLLDLDQVDEDVLRAHVQLEAQAFDYALVEGLFHLDATAFVQRDLDGDEAVGAVDVEIVRVEDEALARVLGDDLEPVLERHVQGVEHRLVDDVAYLPAEALTL